MSAAENAAQTCSTIVMPFHDKCRFALKRQIVDVVQRQGEPCAHQDHQPDRLGHRVKAAKWAGRQRSPIYGSSGSDIIWPCSSDSLIKPAHLPRALMANPLSPDVPEVRSAMLLEPIESHRIVDQQLSLQLRCGCNARNDVDQGAIVRDAVLHIRMRPIATP